MPKFLLFKNANALTQLYGTRNLFVGAAGGMQSQALSQGVSEALAITFDGTLDCHILLPHVILN